MQALSSLDFVSSDGKMLRMNSEQSAYFCSGAASAGAASAGAAASAAGAASAGAAAAAIKDGVARKMVNVEKYRMDLEERGWGV